MGSDIDVGNFLTADRYAAERYVERRQNVKL